MTQTTPTHRFEITIGLDGQMGPGRFNTIAQGLADYLTEELGGLSHRDLVITKRQRETRMTSLIWQPDGETSPEMQQVIDEDNRRDRP